MPNECEQENDLIDGMTVEQIRDRLRTPNRCWSDTYCDCAQQHAADRLMEHYDALAARLAEAERLLADIIDDAAFMACGCGSPTCRTTIVRNFLQQNVVAESSPRATESPESQGIVACKLHSATVSATGVSNGEG